MQPASDPDPLLTDRTTIETDQKCGMARWWYKEEAASGIVPAEEAAYYKDGRDSHAAAELLVTGERVEDVLRSFPLSGDNQLTLESQTRLQGWIAGLGRFIFPLLLEGAEILMVEKELCLQRDPLWIACKPDLVIRNKQGQIIVIDYKSTGRVSKGWVDYWPLAVQHHINLKAVEEELGEKPAYGQVIGLYKGEWKYGRLNHPYVWAYGDASRPDEWATDYPEAKKRGLTNRPLWEYNAGILHWVERLGFEEARGVFPFSAPIFLNERLLEDLITARTRREEEVARVKPVVLADRRLIPAYFEPRYSQCRPVIGAPCAYLAACHNASVNADPLGSGLYVKRTPHHELELLGLEE
jgi:hypothetical protein